MCCCRPRADRGTTIIELMIASALLMIVLSGVSLLISASSRQFMVMDASLDLQRESVLAANWVTREMAESNENTVLYYAPAAPDPEAVTIASPRTVTGGMQYTNGGALVWQKKVCFFIGTSATGRSILERIERPLTPYKTSYPPTMHVAQDGPAQFLSDSSLPRRLVAKDVDSLQVDTSIRPVQVTLELSAMRHGKPFSATIQSKVHFRN